MLRSVSQIHVRGRYPPRHPLRRFGYDDGAEDDSPVVRLPSTYPSSVPPPFDFDGEPLFVCVDIERHCRNQRITEFGIAVFDLRDLLPKFSDEPEGTVSRSPLVPPGDRASAYFKSIKSEHFRAADNLHNDYDENHGFWCRPRPDQYAFGATRYQPSDHFRRFGDSLFRNYRLRNLRPEEIRNKIQRRVIFCAFDTQAEETYLYAQHVSWFQKADEIWDIQRLPFARKLAGRLGKDRISLEDMRYWLGLNFPPELLHNGGNDASVEIQGMLAGLHLSKDQWSNLGYEPCLPELEKHWSSTAVQRNERGARVKAEEALNRAGSGRRS